MKRISVLILLTITANTIFAQAKTAIIRSAITFQIKNIGITTGGSIGGLQVDGRFNPADLTASALEASVSVSTLNTDNDDRDEHLKSDDFFDAAHYPKITLKSISFKHKSSSNYSGQFNLTMKDKTKAVEIPFSVTDKGSSQVLKGSFKINRLDYGVGTDSFTLSNDVIINIEAELGK